LPDPPVTAAGADPGPLALMDSMRRVISARTPASALGLTSGAVLQRCLTGPDVKNATTNTVENWEEYFRKLRPKLLAYELTARPEDLGLPASTTLTDVQRILAKEVATALGTFARNLNSGTTEAKAKWAHLKTDWEELRAINDAVRRYKDADQKQLAIEAAAVERAATTFTDEEHGWVSDIELGALAIGISAKEAAAIARSVTVVRAEKDMSSKFLKLIAQIFKELSFAHDRFDHASLCNHLRKLKTDKEGFSGIIAEVEAALRLLEQGVVDPAVDIVLGYDVRRPRPYMADLDTQDIDIVYVDVVGGRLTLVEVKDAVLTLEKKMNTNAGGKYVVDPSIIQPHKPTQHEHHFDAKQVSSLIAARNQVDLTRGQAVLRIFCVRPRGWVRFTLSHHCLTLCNNNVTLQIGRVVLRPPKLRALRSYLELQMDLLESPSAADIGTHTGWRARQRHRPTPGAGHSGVSGATTTTTTTTPQPFTDRDQLLWDYEQDAENAWGKHPFTDG
jgi:hypothetical protein